MYTSSLVNLLLAISAAAMPFLAAVTVPQEHFEVVRLRASTTVDPAAVTGTTCTDASAYVPSIQNAEPKIYYSQSS